MKSNMDPARQEDLGHGSRVLPKMASLLVEQQQESNPTVSLPRLGVKATFTTIVCLYLCICTNRGALPNTTFKTRSDLVTILLLVGDAVAFPKSYGILERPAH
jgi:hypothetical protein